MDQVAGKVKKVGRRRRAAGWTLLLLGLLVAAVWVASGRWSASYASDEQHYSLRRGGIAWSLMPKRWRSGAPMRFDVSANDPDDRGWDWWDALAWQPPDYVSVGVFGQMVSFNRDATPPLDTGGLGRVLFWPVPLLLWTSAALLLRSGIVVRRRAVNGQCAKCGYDLAGLGDGVSCPECGRGVGTK